jgi:hypothetical protein
MELEGLHVPTRAPWLPDLKQSCSPFFQGKHDDQVDALGLEGQLLDRWAPGGVPKVEPWVSSAPPHSMAALTILRSKQCELLIEHEPKSWLLAALFSDGACNVDGVKSPDHLVSGFLSPAAFCAA